MQRSEGQLRRDALAIWTAGVDAVRSDRLVQDAIERDGQMLRLGDAEIDLRSIENIIVVGGGKAGGGMAAGLEAALGPDLLRAKRLRGWVNVPEGMVAETKAIHLHAARPAGLNEPTPAGVAGTERMLELVKACGPNDLCICLLSGGASALMPAPVAGVELAAKQLLARRLSLAGANIAELNTVRAQLSRVKGGGLARAMKAGRLIALIISDVLGDPLDVIASGPTVPARTTAADALKVLQKYGLLRDPALSSIVTYLQQARPKATAQSGAEVHNFVIGNNAIAVDAAGLAAEKLGYSHAMHAATTLEGEAEDVGRHLASMALHMRDGTGPDCLITGGEPVVKIPAGQTPGRGGRNQQLVLAALEQLGGAAGLALLSGGTDGEDGPTDAAGAIVDAAVVRKGQALRLNPREYLQQHNAYPFFEATGGLIKTGPTGTNVCDVRVVVVSRK